MIGRQHIYQEEEEEKGVTRRQQKEQWQLAKVNVKLQEARHHRRLLDEALRTQAEKYVLSREEVKDEESNRRNNKLQETKARDNKGGPRKSTLGARMAVVQRGLALTLMVATMSV